MPCDPNIMQTRSRQVLRSPLNPKTCPEGSQMQPCVLNQNCFQYHYNLTGLSGVADRTKCNYDVSLDWSTCQLSENATCGQGMRNRLLSCTRSDGKAVNMNYCEQVRFHMAQLCRDALDPACFLIICTLEDKILWGGQCGDGIQVRNLTCMVHDGSSSPASKNVESALCGELPSKDGELQLPCSVPCPGDCHLIEWSEWSPCELTCIDGRSFETPGRQSRSRTFIIQSFENRDSCPEQEVETRPCSGGKCYNYVWKTSPWRDNERTVWCQRSDGVNVTGGCSVQMQPAATRHCNPACRKPFSFCTQSGVCGCERGYTEIMRSNGFLDYCMKIPGLEDKKADVKTNAAKNKPVNSKMHDIFKGWSIQPFNPDGKLKIWVYGVSAGGFLIIVSLIFTSYLVCKQPKQQQPAPPQQKCLTLAYDGDVDM
ncbi:hypothetical protein lerEdw1_003265 [Lerista edwardsae]|nr:hypothetical protein lerEdw1_003265 [Lerista edwardsae]